jgi:hypothetical protein
VPHLCAGPRARRCLNDVGDDGVKPSPTLLRKPWLAHSRPGGGRLLHRQSAQPRAQRTLVVLGFTGGEIPTVKVKRVLLRNVSVLGTGWGRVHRSWLPSSAVGDPGPAPRTGRAADHRTHDLLVRRRHRRPADARNPFHHKHYRPLGPPFLATITTPATRKFQMCNSTSTCDPILLVGQRGRASSRRKSRSSIPRCRWKVRPG